jgi:hypothetical protein
LSILLRAAASARRRRRLYQRRKRAPASRDDQQILLIKDFGNVALIGATTNCPAPLRNSVGAGQSAVDTARRIYRFARRARRAFLAGRRAWLFLTRFTRRADFFTADDERAAFDLLRRCDLRAVLAFLCFLLRIETSPRSYAQRSDSGLEVNNSFVGQAFFKSRTMNNSPLPCLRMANIW